MMAKTRLNASGRGDLFGPEQAGGRAAQGQVGGDGTHEGIVVGQEDAGAEEVAQGYAAVELGAVGAVAVVIELGGHAHGFGGIGERLEGRRAAGDMPPEEAREGDLAVGEEMGGAGGAGAGDDDAVRAGGRDRRGEEAAGTIGVVDEGDLAGKGWLGGYRARRPVGRR